MRWCLLGTRRVRTCHSKTRCRGMGRSDSRRAGWSFRRPGAIFRGVRWARMILLFAGRRGVYSRSRGKLLGVDDTRFGCSSLPNRRLQRLPPPFVRTAGIVPARPTPARQFGLGGQVTVRRRGPQPSTGRRPWCPYGLRLAPTLLTIRVCRRTVPACNPSFSRRPNPPQRAEPRLRTTVRGPPHRPPHSARHIPAFRHRPHPAPPAAAPPAPPPTPHHPPPPPPASSPLPPPPPPPPLSANVPRPTPPGIGCGDKITTLGPPRTPIIPDLLACFR